MKEIPLTHNKVALVDDDIYEWVSLQAWYCTNAGYVARDFTRNKKRVSVLLHRLIMNAPEDKEIDHIDGNKLNNVRSNLRICTRTQNAANIRKQSGECSSKHKGVYWDKTRKHYRVEINTIIGGYYIGAFTSEDEAGLAYNLAAISIQGEFAKLNDIPSDVMLPFKTKIIRSSSSIHKGISYDQHHSSKWYAYIDKDKKRIWCKRFNSEEEANMVRQKKLIEFGIIEK